MCILHFIRAMVKTHFHDQVSSRFAAKCLMTSSSVATYLAHSIFIILVDQMLTRREMFRRMLEVAELNCKHVYMHLDTNTVNFA